jgi:hypothetical protein
MSLIQVQPLPQGLLQRTINLKLRAREWRVVITLEHEHLHYDSLLSAIQRLLRTEHIRSSEWASQQLSTMERGVRSWGHSRRRRGWFDGIGKVAHELLGLATDAEVREVRSKIDENRTLMKKMSIWSKNCLIIINATHSDIILNRNLINNITMDTIRMIDLTLLITTLKDQLHQLELARRRQATVRRDLERGRLTEALFPPRLFSSLTRQRGELWLPAEWYYRWCTITPLWNELNQFVVRLPLVTHERVIGYELETFPIWGPHNSTVQLDLNKLAALDTTTGVISEPHRCHGRTPMVCDPGIIDERSCLAAVIAQRDMGDFCSVIVREHPPLFRLLATNDLVLLVDQPGVLEERCPDEQRPSTISITRGTQRVQWSEGCRLTTSRFSILSLPTSEGHRTVRT